MGCKKTMAKIGKTLAPVIVPSLVRYIGGRVLDVERAAAEDPLFWDNHTKRKVVIDQAAAEAKRLGLDAKENVLRMTTEYVVFALKKAEAKLEEIGGDNDPSDDPLPVPIP